MTRLASLLDNPIFVKHLRSRLRRSELVSTLLIVGVLLLLICWWGIQSDNFSTQGVFTITLVLQGIILLIAGSGQVAASVSNARASGILDFHRISPLAPSVQALGFLLGPPVREYLAFALTLPVSLACVAQGGVTWTDFLQWVGLALLVAWAFHSWTMVAALFSRKPTKNGPIGLLVFLGIMGFNLFGTIFSRLGGPGATAMEFQFFGIIIPWFAFASLYLVPAIFFGMLIATRKIRYERRHPLSKIEAVGFMAVVAVLAVGGIWPRVDPDAVVIIVVYILVVFGLMLAITITPTLGEYTRGIRRAARLGVRHLPPWDELALNRPALTCVCLIALAAASVTLRLVQNNLSGSARFSLSIAVGVLTIAYFGLAYQYFALLKPKRSATFMVVFLFLAWIAPLLAWVVGMSVGLPSTANGALSGFTPVTGLAVIASASPFGEEALPAAQIAAISPAIGFSFLFFFLVTSLRRKIDREVRGVMIPPKPTNPFDPPESKLEPELQGWQA